MPATTVDVLHPYQTKFYYSEDGGDNYVQIGEIVGIIPPGPTRSVGDSTRLDAADMVKTKIRGWIDAGQVTVRIQLTSAGYNILEGLYYKDAQEDYDHFKIEFPLLDSQVTPITFDWDGFLVELPTSEGSVDTDDPYQNDVVIEISGRVTFTEAA